MYADTNYQIAKDRIADLHVQAEHHALARAASRGRRPSWHQARHGVSRLLVIARRGAVTALGAHT